MLFFSFLPDLIVFIGVCDCFFVLCRYVYLRIFARFWIQLFLAYKSYFGVLNKFMNGWDVCMVAGRLKDVVQCNWCPAAYSRIPNRCPITLIWFRHCFIFICSEDIKYHLLAGVSITSSRLLVGCVWQIYPMKIDMSLESIMFLSLVFITLICISEFWPNGRQINTNRFGQVVLDFLFF